jgi:ribosomal protein RSM22 (predicted rRNA methylase)
MSKDLTELEISQDLILKVFQDSSIAEGGGIIWDAARVMLHFLSKKNHGFRDYLGEAKLGTIVELGAGTGVAGLALAKLFSDSHRVILTEYSSGCLELMKESIEINGLGERVKQVSMKWGREEAQGFLKTDIGEDSVVDLIIGTDLVYDSFLFGPLCDTIEALSSPHTRCFLACTDHGNLQSFLDILS